eukprot:CAMPEP_0172679764 /NCGR_PEP_ID=MMETSP1074-20121228/16297_1 /TAXON_ID=2916 /ORGANISM="Ceratium fusus, Strain PA161109" /LENGTH=213 /DNA_ID=CAMNT_0013497993 /DNA_START=68 /DNA_END=705 /DNA_ORIENTATION=-
MLYPLSMFCCGCSVPIGVGIILVCHLVACCFYVASACSNLIFHVPLFTSAWSGQMQLLYTAFSLVGIPTIFVAMWGLIMRVEANIRLYLFYLAFSVFVDMMAMVFYTLVRDPCDTLAGILLSMKQGSGSARSGEAFMCGTFRIVSYLSVSAMVLVEVYCIWVVWSLCEDVHSGKNGPELSELMPSKNAVVQKVKRVPEGPYDDIAGFAHSKVP